MIIGPRRNENGLLNILVDDSDITHVKSMKYLGLEIDDYLTWNNYVNQLCKILYLKTSKLAKLSKTLSK